MSELPHQFHLLHDVPRNVFPLVKVNFLDADEITAILGRVTHVGGAITAGFAAQAAAQALARGAGVETVALLSG